MLGVATPKVLLPGAPGPDEPKMGYEPSTHAESVAGERRLICYCGSEPVASVEQDVRAGPLVRSEGVAPVGSLAHTAAALSPRDRYRWAGRPPPRATRPPPPPACGRDGSSRRCGS